MYRPYLALVGLGVGIGFFLAGLLLLVFAPSGPSREQIINEARKYGMVFREEVLPFSWTSGPAQAEKPPENTPQDAGPKPEEKPEETKPQEILVTIPAGATLEEIASLLEKQGVVPAAAFEAEARKAGATGKIKAGSHYLPKGDVGAVLKRLTE